MQQAGMEHGAREYLVKSSTTPADLSVRVRRWIGRSETND
jgi:hypothetical protein